MKRVFALASISSLVGTGGAFADNHKGNPAVMARQAHMQLYQFNLGYLGQTARGRIEYNADLAQIAANNLLALAALDQARTWPADTDVMSIDGTRAMPQLWEEPDRVAKISKELLLAAERMASVAGLGANEMAAAVGPVGQACRACHKAFREPED